MVFLINTGTAWQCGPAVVALLCAWRLPYTPQLMFAHVLSTCREAPGPPRRSQTALPPPPSVLRPPLPPCFRFCCSHSDYPPNPPPPRALIQSGISVNKQGKQHSAEVTLNYYRTPAVRGNKWGKGESRQEGSELSENKNVDEGPIFRSIQYSVSLSLKFCSLCLHRAFNVLVDIHDDVTNT